MKRGIFMALTAVVICASALPAADNPLPHRIRVITELRDGLFPVPAGMEELTVPNGDFAVAGTPAANWSMFPYKGVNPAEVVKDISKGALPPGTERYMRLPANAAWVLYSPDIEVRGGRPHLLSLWVRSTVASGNGRMGHTAGGPELGSTALRLPDTGGAWKRVGIYFRPTYGAVKSRMYFYLGQAEGTIDIADLRLRTATEEELADAYAHWRAGYEPPLEVGPGSDFGRNLALSVAKLRGEAGIPGEPFVVWGTGSSFTLFLLSGENFEDWRQHIRKNFPKAGDVVLKLTVGSALPWQYCYGFVVQEGIPQQPDLVITYTTGEPEDLDKMLSYIRRYTTADIIVPTIHMGKNDTLTPKFIENPYWKLDAVREVCSRYGAELVENRRELALWLEKTGRLPKDMILTNEDTDTAHQNELGRLLINENAVRHLTENLQPAYDYRQRERMFKLSDLRRAGSALLKAAGVWNREGELLAASQKGASLEFKFNGNRIDLIGRSLPGGGTVRVFIDGKPADQAPVFYTTGVKLTETVAPAESRDIYWKHYYPHGVFLEKNVVPQTWTVRMTDDEGNFELVGSVTGVDGKGHFRKPFTSTSGQIRLEPSLWRSANDAKPADIVYMRQGDAWSFDVYRCAVGSVSFDGQGGPLHQPLVQNLPNGPHTLRLEADGKGKIAVDALYVFTPPLKP